MSAVSRVLRTNVAGVSLGFRAFNTQFTNDSRVVIPSNLDARRERHRQHMIPVLLKKRFHRLIHERKREDERERERLGIVKVDRHATRPATLPASAPFGLLVCDNVDKIPGPDILNLFKEFSPISVVMRHPRKGFGNIYFESEENMLGALSLSGQKEVRGLTLKACARIEKWHDVLNGPAPYTAYIWDILRNTTEGDVMKALAPLDVTSAKIIMTEGTSAKGMTGGAYAVVEFASREHLIETIVHRSCEGLFLAPYPFTRSR